MSGMHRNVPGVYAAEYWVYNWLWSVILDWLHWGFVTNEQLSFSPMSEANDILQANWPHGFMSARHPPTPLHTVGNLKKKMARHPWTHVAIALPHLCKTVSQLNSPVCYLVSGQGFLPPAHVWERTNLKHIPMWHVACGGVMDRTCAFMLWCTWMHKWVYNLESQLQLLLILPPKGVYDVLLR